MERSETYRQEAWVEAEALTHNMPNRDASSSPLVIPFIRHRLELIASIIPTTFVNSFHIVKFRWLAHVDFTSLCSRCWRGFSTLKYLVCPT
jgi:hypothetical protein